MMQYITLVLGLKKGSKENTEDQNQIFNEMSRWPNILRHYKFSIIASYWSDVMTKPDDPSSIQRSHAFAKKMIETPKVVFTKTLKKSQWANTDVATGDLTDEITKLKSQDSKDIIVYGGASFD